MIRRRRGLSRGRVLVENFEMERGMRINFGHTVVLLDRFGFGGVGTD